VVFQTAGNDPGHGLISVAHEHLFAIANELNMGAELCFQIADIDGSHSEIVTNMTMLVIRYLSCLECEGKGNMLRLGPAEFL
jgi:hypothetical protein